MVTGGVELTAGITITVKGYTAEIPVPVVIVPAVSPGPAKPWRLNM
jgi:hypothetical protein